MVNNLDFHIRITMIVISDQFLMDRWLKKYLRLSLVFMWNSAQWENFNFYFSIFQEFSSSIDKAFILARGLGTGPSFYVI